MVTNMKFSECGAYLETNRGILKVGPEYNYDTSKLPKSYSNLHMQDDGHWVALDGEKVLWLPPEYRSRCSAFYDNTLVLGQSSGRISFIVF